tara:strand:+ start:786285 stop:786944 length:660 start_codon:yes stop_codon:yes gene_type:complete
MIGALEEVEVETPRTIFDIIYSDNAQELEDYLAESPDSLEATYGRYKSTPLLWAVLNDKLQCLKILIKAGADLNAQDADSDTALICASKKGLNKGISLLLKADADTTIVNAEGKTAEQYAEAKSTKNLFIRHHAGQFIKESDTMVSIMNYVDSCAMTIKSIYNFEAANITTQSKDNDGQSLFVQEFNLRSPQKQLIQAAQFLKQQENGDLCGFKLPTII